MAYIVFTVMAYTVCIAMACIVDSYANATVWKAARSGGGGGGGGYGQRWYVGMPSHAAVHF